MLCYKLRPDPVHDASLQHLEDVVIEECGELRVLLQCDTLIELNRLVDVQRLDSVVGPGPGWQFKGKLARVGPFLQWKGLSRHFNFDLWHLFPCLCQLNCHPGSTVE